MWLCFGSISYLKSNKTFPTFPHVFWRCKRSTLWWVLLEIYVGSYSNHVTVANQGLFIGIPGCLKTSHVILVGDWHPGWGGFQQLEVECMACSQGHSEVIPLGGGWVGGKWLDMVWLVGDWWWIEHLNSSCVTTHQAILSRRWSPLKAAGERTIVCNHQVVQQNFFCNTTCGSLLELHCWP